MESSGSRVQWKGMEEFMNVFHDLYLKEQFMICWISGHRVWLWVGGSSRPPTQCVSIWQTGNLGMNTVKHNKYFSDKNVFLIHKYF